MIKDAWTYYVAYAHLRGFGSIEIIMDKQIAAYSQVRAVCEEISAKNGYRVDDVIVLNYQLMKSPEVPEQ